MKLERNVSRKFWETVRERGELARMKLKQKFAAEVNGLRGIQRRLEEKRKEEHLRALQYHDELEAMKKRVMSRALIVEQQEMLIRKQQFERKYSETMSRAKTATQKKANFQKHLISELPERYEGTGVREAVAHIGSTFASDNGDAAEEFGNDKNQNDHEDDRSNDGDDDVYSESDDTDEDEDDEGTTADSSEEHLSKISERTEKSSIS
ncbi:unnamed protein product [Gongylonema pulchrum]|uniref:Pinin_SDK_memA domain-containing protein n=1 Tax=Gongylonema pulchrum TaxID=637853 RepID=A0A183E3M3_9BILA|nr:unnamed protein product [Gongylonema pulchrum]